MVIRARGRTYSVSYYNPGSLRALRLFRLQKEALRLSP
jgi:hypothetical protein